MGKRARLLLVALGLAYPFLLHLIIRAGELPDLAYLPALVPVLLWAGWRLASWAGPAWRLVLGMVLIALIVSLAVAGQVRLGLIAFDGLTHAAINLFLLWLFGRTLLPGQEPLISSVSRLVRGEADPAIASYTRNVTIAWTGFFALQLALSALLLLFAPLPAWSLFVNVLNLPLLAAMFAGEYLLRLVLHPEHARVPVARVAAAFAEAARGRAGA